MRNIDARIFSCAEPIQKGQKIMFGLALAFGLSGPTPVGHELLWYLG
jgi:hypothetical protein